MSNLDPKRPSAVIFGCAGPALSLAERAFFAESDPLGFILFARNCETPDQIRGLVDALRDTVGRPDAPVLIDQEGGRVARLKPPHWRAAPPAARFGALAERSLDRARRAVWLNARLLAAELLDLGITVDCAPVLDLPAEGSHDIIGDRAFGRDAELVATLGRAAIDGFLDGGILPVVKHVPGHGRATADSHFDLPIVDADRATLAASDFVPFRRLHDAPWAMTAHVLFRELDPEAPVSVSRRVIEDIIRGHIGFDGVLLSDDLSMKALSGGLGERAAAVLAAGCDVALHCNGEMDEMRAIAGSTRRLSDDALARIDRAETRRRRATPGTAGAFRDELAALLDEPQIASR